MGWILAGAAGCVVGFALRATAPRLARTGSAGIPFRLPWLEVLTGVAFALIHVKRGGFEAADLKWYLFAGLLAAITATDLLAKLIPDRVTFPGAALGLILSAIWPSDISGYFDQGLRIVPFLPDGPVTGFVLALIGAAAGFAVVEGFRRVFGALAGMEVMGMGDSKLVFMMGAFLGPLAVVFALLPGVFAGLFLGIAYTKLAKTPHFPFGPALGLGGLLTVLYRDEIVAAIESAMGALTSLSGGFVIVLQLLLLGTAGGLILRIRRRRAEYTRRIEEDYGNLTVEAREEPAPADLARRYVELSNAGDLDRALAMFAEDATYDSSQAGSFVGRDAIQEMMRGFFARFSGAHWKVAKYSPRSGGAVEFKFVMRATESKTGKKVERKGTERITFDDKGLIRHVSVRVADS